MMAHPEAYPPGLTEIEKIEIASAISYHFDRCAMPDKGPFGSEREDQYDILCAIVQRILNRRAGLFPERSVR